MSILISHNGEDRGPYGLNELRELVRTGQISLDDLAWIEGSPSWVPLRNIPGFLPIPPGTPPIKPGAETPSTDTEEKDLWRGHPSQALNLKIYVLWTLALGAALAAGFVQSLAFYLAGGIALVALIHCGYVYIRLRSIEYVVTTQRVRIISGLFSKNIDEIELFRVKDTSAHQAFFQRLFGLGTITILSGDERTPKLVLEGIPNPIELRERLRHDVLNLRQRFGVRELDVM